MEDGTAFLLLLSEARARATHKLVVLREKFGGLGEELRVGAAVERLRQLGQRAKEAVREAEVHRLGNLPAALVQLHRLVDQALLLVVRRGLEHVPTARLERKAVAIIASK